MRRIGIAIVVGLASFVLASTPAWARDGQRGGSATVSNSGLSATASVSGRGVSVGAPGSSSGSSGGGSTGPACTYSDSATIDGTSTYDQVCGSCGYAILNVTPTTPSSPTSLLGTVENKYPNSGYTAGTNGYFVAGPCVGGGGVKFYPVGTGPAASAAPAPVQVAATAETEAPWPKVAISQGPDPASDATVNINNWFDITSGWEPVHATATVDGVSETINATPIQTKFATEYTDATNYPSLSLVSTTFSCDGPGVAYTPAKMSETPPCGYTWHWSSELGPNQTFPLSAQVCYSVSYSGVASGSLGTHCGPSTTIYESVGQIDIVLGPPEIGVS